MCHALHYSCYSRSFNIHCCFAQFSYYWLLQAKINCKYFTSSLQVQTGSEVFTTYVNVVAKVEAVAEISAII